MKKTIFLIILLGALSTFAQPISKHKAAAIAHTFLDFQKLTYSIESVKTYTDSIGNKLFYIINAKPTGFVVVAADRQLSPIIAWSISSQLNLKEGYAPILKDCLVKYKSLSASFSDTQKATIEQKWQKFEEKNYEQTMIQSWPAAGTTSNEGWLETRWTQTSPYNLQCPMDPVTNTRSYAGCPAIVMGQILNYLKTTMNTRFDNSDDYEHNYGGRNYQIDDDADIIDFPSFPHLNNQLDSIDLSFQSNHILSNQEAAALIFACGTACTQVYTSLGSGTMAINQAFDAYKRFGFGGCELYETADSAMYYTLISNLKNGYPAHLAVVDATWSTGHNVAVDGYREDGYFHINFGWGGTSDGWWLIPDPSFPYSMGTLEGIILNIIPSQSSIKKYNVPKALTIYPNPASDSIHLSSLFQQSLPYTIYNMSGQMVQSGKTSENIFIGKLTSGNYIIQVHTNDEVQVGKFMVQ